MDDMNKSPFASHSATGGKPRHAKPRDSLLPFALVAIGVTVYCGFTFLCLDSTPVDRDAGSLLLLNVPVMLIWLVTLIKTNRLRFAAGIAAAVIQGLIAAAMISRGIGDIEAVVAINSGAIFTILLLVRIDQKYRRRADQGAAPTPAAG